jgi:hypothetical protein
MSQGEQLTEEQKEAEEQLIDITGSILRQALHRAGCVSRHASRSSPLQEDREDVMAKGRAGVPKTGQVTRQVTWIKCLSMPIISSQRECLEYSSQRAAGAGV